MASPNALELLPVDANSYSNRKAAIWSHQNINLWNSCFDAMDISQDWTQYIVRNFKLSSCTKIELSFMIGCGIPDEMELLY